MPVPLERRAVHPFFLRKLAQQEVDGVVLGDLTTAQVVQVFIKPATVNTRRSYAESVLAVKVAPKFVLPWSTAGSLRSVDGAPHQAFGPARYFASHAWGYKFGSLVSMLDGHYAQLPGSQGGAKYLPAFYWVDVLAVTQHFVGDFKDHPDSDFQAVIRSCKSVLFTMHPWRSPIAPTRVWCLYEALTAIQSPGVDIEVVVDVKDSKDTRVQTLQIISSSIEVRTAQASVSSDKAYILGRIEAGIGIAAFNQTIRKRLREALLAAVMSRAVEMGDTAALHELLKAGGCARPDGVFDLPALFKHASEAELLRVLASMLPDRARRLETPRPRPRGLALSGPARCREVALRDMGLRGWDGAGLSLREYSETETGRVLWGYLPASPALCQAVAELLVVPAGGAGSSVAPFAGSAGRGVGGGGGGGGGLEELWISLRAPRPDDFPRDFAAITAAIAAAAAGSTGAVIGAAASAPSSPELLDGSLPAVAAGPAPTAAAIYGRSLSSSTVGGSAGGGGIAPGSATAARAAARAAAAASPTRRRSAAPVLHRSSTFGSGSARSSLVSSPRAHLTRTSTSSSSGLTPTPLTGLRPSSPFRRPSAPGNMVPPVSSLRHSASGVFAPAARDGASLAAGGDGAVDADAGVAGPRVALPAGGRAALWAAVGASSTLRMLCLHQAVLGPQDLRLLSAALQATTALDTLQAVKCVAAAAAAADGAAVDVPATGRGGAAAVGGTGWLTSELLAMGLSCRRLRQLHIRPADVVMIEAFPDTLDPPASSQLRRMTLAPVALGPPAVRQLGSALAVPPQLHALVAGMDPAPPATWMPKEATERDQWLAHEDRHEPEMAARRRRHLGLDEEGQAALVANAWELSEELACLPDPERGPAALRQRAAGLSFCLGLSCGWRDADAHARAYARWAWARKGQQQDPGLVQLQHRREEYRSLLSELLQAAPDAFALKFNPQIEQRRRGTKSRLQATYFALFC